MDGRCERLLLVPIGLAMVPVVTAVVTTGCRTTLAP
jgi:hypothetical protein